MNAHFNETKKSLGTIKGRVTVGNMKALFAQKALYSASPILPQAAFPALPARGGAAGRAR